MMPAAKRLKKEILNLSSLSKFFQQIEKERLNAGKSINDFKFSKKRVKILSKAEIVPHDAERILYWMSRDQRVEDNWALLYAQKMALKVKLPLVVCFCLRTEFLDATLRHYLFMIKGLQEVEQTLKKYNIQFILLLGKAEEILPKFIEDNKVGALVSDVGPLRISLDWIEKIKNKLPENVPFCQVDAHNIVPLWEASDKLEYSARTIRNKINKQLNIYLTQFPSVLKHPHDLLNDNNKMVNWEKIIKSLKVDDRVKELKWSIPGYEAGMNMLYEFCQKRLPQYASQRNNPNMDAISNLSPWFHFGQISVQRCILYVKQFSNLYKESVDAFCEETIVRRELSDNFCYYNKDYDNIQGAWSWAQKTLTDHKHDKREYIYSLEQFESSKTHDNLWNSAQNQLVNEGKIHGYLRMYWAKKILEWTNSPEEALSISIYLNDRYSIDGRDPNGYVGCMWSICGVHDQGWRERPIFGKIRFMNYEGCKRKFNVSEFVQKYGG